MKVTGVDGPDDEGPNLLGVPTPVTVPGTLGPNRAGDESERPKDEADDVEAISQGGHGIGALDAQARHQAGGQFHFAFVLRGIAGKTATGNGVSGQGVGRSRHQCAPTQSAEDLLSQRREDVHFHDILAAASPNPFLRFTCEIINEMIRELIVYGNRTPLSEHRRFGEVNADFHRDILNAARARDADEVRRLMSEHMRDAAANVKRMKGRIQGRLILDTEGTRRPAAAKTGAGTARAKPGSSTTGRKKPHP